MIGGSMKLYLINPCFLSSVTTLQNKGTFLPTRTCDLFFFYFFFYPPKYSQIEMAARMRVINWESVWDQCQRNREETREGKRAPPMRVSPSASPSSSSEEAALQPSSYHRLTPKKKAPMTGTAAAVESHRDSTNQSGFLWTKTSIVENSGSLPSISLNSH